MSASPAAPTVSVLMSVYNGQRYLAQAMDSILGQTFSDFELITIDDGSKDSSPGILRGYASRDPRVKVTVRENKGLTKTLNEAFRRSRGQFIARMDCDDVAMPDRFARQLDALRADPGLVCVGGNFQLIDGDGRALTVLVPPADDATIQKKALAGHGAICHPTAMIRRTAMEQIDGYDESFKTAQDLDLWLRLGEVGRLGNVPHTVLQFRLHEGSVSETKRHEQRQSARRACENAWKRRGITNGSFEADEPWRPGQDAESKQRFALQYGWWAFNSGERRTALHYGMKAVRAKPLGPAGWRLLVCAAVKPVGKRAS